MKKLLLLALVASLFSCSSEKKLCPAYSGDGIFITRKYIGNYIDYRHTGPDVCCGTDLIWIRTTLDNTFGKLSAYSKTCDFRPGDRIYLNSTYSASGPTGNWEYEIGNDSSGYYRVSDVRFENKKFVRAWKQ